MHDTMKRLYTAARELHQLEGQSAIARKLNASPQTVKNWETRGISQKGLIEIQKTLAISIEWLETGKGQMQTLAKLPEKGDVSDIHRPALWSSSSPLPEDDYVFTPYLKESVFQGGGGAFEIPDYNGFRLPFGKATLRRKSILPDNVFCCTLTGNSMEPRIAENAAIAVDTGIERIIDGKIYAFQHDDLFRVKYLYRLPGGRIRIHSENTAEYPDEEAAAENIRIIGRVFWWSVLD